MEHRWFWKTQGNSYGPMTTEELDHLIEAGRIAGSDQLQIEGTDEWILAAQVMAQLSASADPASGASASDEAARLLASANLMRAKTSSGGRRRRRATTSFARPFSRWFSRCTEWLSTGIEYLLRLLIPLFRSKTALIVVVVLLAAILFKDVGFDKARNQHTFEELSTTWTQLQNLRKQSGAEARRKQFEEKTLSWLKPQIKELEQVAKRKPTNSEGFISSDKEAAEARRQLIMAARSLSRILQRAPRLDNEYEDAVFGGHMANAYGYLSGELPTHLKFWARNDAEQPAQAAADGTDPLMAGTIVTDVAVVLAAVLWWYLSRRRRTYA